MSEKIKIESIQETSGKGPENLDRAQILKSIEHLFTKEFFLGDGRTANVYEDNVNNCCYKVFDKPFSKGVFINSIDEEISLQSVAKEESDKKGKIKIPAPLFAVTALLEEDRGGKPFKKRITIFVMEKIHGPTLDQIIKGERPLPANFNLERSFADLEEFFSDLHANQRIYHRDFHERNLMIEETTGMLSVIDFGQSVKIVLADEDPYEDIVSTPGLTDKTDYYKHLDDLKQTALLKDRLKARLDDK